MKSDMLLAVMQLSAERNLPQESVISAFEEAIAAAYRRDPAARDQDVRARLDPDSGQVQINTILHVVDELDEIDPRGQIIVDEARAMNDDAQPGDEIITGYLEFTPQRIAARTVTQVLMQRLRSAERRLVYEQYADKEGEIISAPIRRIASARSSEDAAGGRPTVFIDLGKADATMPGDEQSPSERYRPGMELKFFVTQVSDYRTEGDGSPEIVVSRRAPMLLRRLIELEVPEVKSGLVEIKSIARQPGARSKVAVSSNQHDIDPIGACVGLRGIRVQNIVTELMGEKIDFLEWSDDPASFIANSLGPAQVEEVIIADETAQVIVPENQLSLAIGKEGQNVSLATRLTNFEINIMGSAAYAEELIEIQRAAEAARIAAEAEEAERIAQAAAAAAAAKAAAEEEERLRAIELEKAMEVSEPEPIEVEVVEEEKELEPVVAAPALFIPGGEDVEEDVEEDEIAVELTDEIEVDLEPVAEEVVEASDDEVEVEDDIEVEEPTTDTEIVDEEFTAAPVASLFVPEIQRPEPEPEPVVDEVEEEEDLDLELLELEEKLRELEEEERERQEAERAAAEAEMAEPDFDSDDLWVLPDDFSSEQETQTSGIMFAEDISGYRDDEGRRRPGRRRNSGPRRNRR